MNTFVRFPEGRKKALTLSYDDAVFQDKRLIEIMQKNGLKGTFNINTGLFAKETGIGRRITKEEAVALYADSGMEVAVHSYSHPFLEQLPLHLAFEEILRDRKEIEQIFGGVCRGMAYPQGTFTDKLADSLKDLGILYSRTTVFTERFDLPLPADWARLPATCHHNHPRLMELAQKFVERDHWRSELFYLWGHSYEFDDNDNWNVIEEFAEYMGGREEIWYATNIEIFSYLEAFHHLQFSADGRRVYNPTLFTLYFSTNKKDLFKVEPGQTLDF